jgi:glyceraldehyde 3-phosphate dehydrogenase
MIKIIDEKAGKLMIGETPVTILRQARNPKDIPWREHGVAVVTECTGKFIDPTLPADTAAGSIRGHLAAGARVVLNSSAFKIKNKGLPQPDDAATLIYGINHGAFDPEKHRIISAASCTTTGLAHMIRPLLENALTKKILTASMSTIHATTNTQSVLDSVPGAGDKDLRKSRSVLNNIILTSTNAAAALVQVIEEVKEIGFMADSIRVPIDTQSLIILNITFQAPRESGQEKTAITREAINDIYRKTAENGENMLIFSDEQNVSSDVTGVNAAIVIEGQFNHTRTAFIKANLNDIPGIPPQIFEVLPDGNLEIPVVHAKIFGWYDNEFGSYTNRLGDLTVHAHKALK